METPERKERLSLLIITTAAFVVINKSEYLGLLKKEIEFLWADSKEATELISMFESPINSPPNFFTRSPDVIVWAIRTI